MPTDTSIVIPIYNTHEIIKDSVNRIVRALEPLKLDYEILLRDDGSVDGSKKVLEQITVEFPRVKCFFNPSNKGLGFTLRKLFHDASGKNIVYCDCDLPFGEKVIPVLLSKLESFDIVIASRYRGASNKIRITRKIYSRLYYFFCKILFNIRVSDIGSGSVAVRKQVMKELSLKADGFDIHTEFYIKASRQGYRIEEIAIETNGGTKGSFSIWTHGPHVIIETIKLYFKSCNGTL